MWGVLGGHAAYHLYFLMVSIQVYLAFPLLLAGYHDAVSWHSLARFLGWGCAIPGLILSWYAAVTYVPLARRALREGRAAGG